MKVKNFEEQLIQMSKPEISELKHEGMLAKAIINAKNKSVLSLWWLAIPAYMLAALFMKSLFVPQTTLISNMHELMSKNKYSSLLFFLVLPIFFIVINFISIRRIYFLSGSPRIAKFLQTVWFNTLMIMLSVIILFFYLL